MEATARDWLKRERGYIYDKICKGSETYFPLGPKHKISRHNLITMTLIRVMKIRYPEQWHEITMKANNIFGLPRGEKRIGQMAWEIALEIGTKRR
jgi:hypothetical protein